MNPKKLFDRIESGSVQNVAFTDMQRLAVAFGFELARVSGSHHFYRHRRVPLVLTLQEVHGQAKAYQVRQLVDAVHRYNLKLEARR